MSKDVGRVYEGQKRQIDKLMSDPDRELPDIGLNPGRNYEPPDFVRNVMGSSAGAGSGEFHVYRHLRRKEMARLKEMDEKAVDEELDKKFQEEFAKMKQDRNSKKREKRQRKKLKVRMIKDSKKKDHPGSQEGRDSSDTAGGILKTNPTTSDVD